MSQKNGSVAPKERVNIVYRPANGDENTSIELPLKLLVVGDYKHKIDNAMLEEMSPVSINNDNFDDVMKAQEISLDILVANKMVENKENGEQYLTLSLSFESIRDFTPDALVEKIPELRRVIEMRDALKALKGPLGNIPEFRKKMQEIVSDRSIREEIIRELRADNIDNRKGDEDE